MANLVTYNSKTNIYGNRLNLVLNHTTKQFYFYGGHVFDKGEVHDEQLQRDIKRIKNYYEKEEGYTSTSHLEASKWTTQEEVTAWANKPTTNYSN